ncbi:MAG: hypothetical protein HYX89_07395 [Chloroflexi bacterium]|nr:hypothetical protein [Chloroflexota bacterium]
MVEGSSDCWTGWYYGLPVLGLPSKSVWRAEWANLMDGLDIYLWQEPDAVDLPSRLANDLPKLKVIRALSGIKDLSEAHLLGEDLAALLNRLKAQAVPVCELLEVGTEAAMREQRDMAAPVLASRDPLELVKADLRRLGYGGDLTPALIVYLAATSRLLAMRRGGMPVHVLVAGVSGLGKSYTCTLVLSLFPPEAYYWLDAGSPRVFIYDTDSKDLRHKVVVFAEVDSLPAAEDNPVASVIRTLLQEHRVAYKVTVRDPNTGEFTVKEVVKECPTVLLTTSTRILGGQLGSRVFTLDMPDDQRQIGAALDTQANLELMDGENPDAGLVAFQAYLQARAPWHVIVPFARQLAAAISKRANAPRILRDFAKLLSLVKAVAVLRHGHRRVDDRGRLIAELEDYVTVYELVSPTFEASASGVSAGVRLVVELVEGLRVRGETGVTVTKVADLMAISKQAASQRVRRAVRAGCLVNLEARRGFPADLQLGERLPEPGGLPLPETLSVKVSTPFTDGSDAVDTLVDVLEV